MLPSNLPPARASLLPSRVATSQVTAQRQQAALVQTAEASSEAGALDGFERSMQAIGRKFYRSDDAKYDGHLVTADGRTFPPETPLSQLPAIEPRRGASDAPTILYVNGMGIDKDRQSGELQGVAERTGSRVVGLHNATEGWLGDFKQAAGDKLDLGHNPAVVALRQLILTELDAGREVHLMAHSHGALITSRALTDVREALEARRWEPARVDGAMGRLMVESFGGAASSYPDGPRYVHYVNTADVQSAAYGMGFSWDPRRNEAGRGAVFAEFSDPDWNPVVTHDFPGTYLPHRKPFNEAHSGG